VISKPNADGLVESTSDPSIEIKHPWSPGDQTHLDLAFWEKVLVGKRIESLDWSLDKNRLVAFHIEGGRSIYIITNENAVATLAVED
jgi:acid phosphatase class B